MNIVHVIEASATGTLAMASLLVNSQIRAGHSVEVVFSRRPETPQDFASHFDSRCRISKIQMYSYTDKVKSLFALRSHLGEVSPDVVFLHSSFSGFLGRLAVLFALRTSKIFYIPHCISFMRRDVGAFKRSIFVLFEWIAAVKRADYVACSRSEYDAIRSAIPFRKCHLVENAVDFSNIPLDVLSTSKESRTVVTVGQIRTQKGPSRFAEIARQVKLKDPDIEFLWIGDGDPGLRAELQAAGVKVVGWVPKARVWDYLGIARIYLSTALWEGMPVSLIEASCAGLPIVASKCAGNVDVVEHGKTGWLYENSNEASVLILNALEDNNMSRDMARLALEIAKKRFSTERYLVEMEQLIEAN